MFAATREHRNRIGVQVNDSSNSWYKKQCPRHIMDAVVCCFSLPFSANLDAVSVLLLQMLTVLFIEQSV